jgi:hypothetical protein
VVSRAIEPAVAVTRTSAVRDEAMTRAGDRPLVVLLWDATK